MKNVIEEDEKIDRINENDYHSWLCRGIATKKKEQNKLFFWLHCIYTK